MPDDAPLIGRWIDVNLTQQVVVAYEARTTARVARASTGRPGWETPPGAYVIQQRVASETMIGASYYVPHVRWMQYFSSDGMALHENYWKALDECGVPQATDAPNSVPLTHSSCGTGQRSARPSSFTPDESSGGS